MSTAEKIVVMQAFEAGKEIECCSRHGTCWRVARTPVWDWTAFEYRVKPAEPVKVVKYVVIDSDGDIYDGFDSEEAANSAAELRNSDTCRFFYQPYVVGTLTYEKAPE